MKNEIKKALYKQKTKAYRHGNTKGGNLLYTTLISLDDHHAIVTKVKFSIPEEEAVGFTDEMDSQLLIRWMIQN